ncbi:MAG: SDR family oxidoreductase [Chitinophagaceae bacterium]|nr:SDR family oxidoreductase [Chitinophagaceae bacterium]
MLLKNKHAVIYGAAGSIGSAVARAVAHEGATVFLTGRTLDKLEKLANEINATGGKAFAAVVDAMNAEEVNNHLVEVTNQVGTIDISFNLIEIENKQDIALTQMSPDDFVYPVEKTMRTQFITSTAAGRVMMKKGSGVILSLTATPGGVGYPLVGGFGAACAALENFSRNLAVELGIYGVRAVNIRSAGSPDSRPFKEAMIAQPEVLGSVINKMKGDTMLKELPLIADIANVAVFLSSDMAAKITGVTIDVTVGTTAGLNHRTTDIEKSNE